MGGLLVFSLSFSLYPDTMETSLARSLTLIRLRRHCSQAILTADRFGRVMGAVSLGWAVIHAALPLLLPLALALPLLGSLEDGCKGLNLRM